MTAMQASCERSSQIPAYWEKPVFCSKLAGLPANAQCAVKQQLGFENGSEKLH